MIEKAHNGDFFPAERALGTSLEPLLDALWMEVVLLVAGEGSDLVFTATLCEVRQTDCTLSAQVKVLLGEGGIVDSQH